VKKLKNHTLKEYLDVLAKKEPIPGGGSVAALAAALAAGLMSMVARYSLGKTPIKRTERKIETVLDRTENLRERLLELVDLDAMAYMKVVRSRGQSPALKKKAKSEARSVPREVSRISYQLLELAPVLASHGNKYLISDVEVAVELLFAAYKSAMINVNVNQ